jgi:NADPH:quinone reductase-like Zn-dependent oxidoreductase
MTNYGEQHMDAVVIQVAGTPAQALDFSFRASAGAGAGEVLVEVHAAGVNPMDVVIAAGILGTPLLPMIPGNRVPRRWTARHPVGGSVVRHGADSQSFAAAAAREGLKWGS